MLICVKFYLLERKGKYIEKNHIFTYDFGLRTFFVHSIHVIIKWRKFIIRIEANRSVNSATWTQIIVIDLK